MKKVMILAALFLGTTAMVNAQETTPAKAAKEVKHAKHAKKHAEKTAEKAAEKMDAPKAKK